MSDPDGPVFDIVYSQGDENDKDREVWCTECYEFGCAACCCNCVCHVGPRCDGYERTQ